ncbi:hypothetical protein [Asticcacaulis sp. AC460]|uniref:hypothetical protein n=1 Tax=Asticcacaulis sp. AC460 TaxID=1282360 RepID=UPI000415598C|nr:hypothetical protein [Asticcacaulis sp. AC460]
MLSVFLMSAALIAQEPVTVNDYRRDYEQPRSESEARYDSRLQQASATRGGQMEGAWQVSTDDGKKLISLELRQSGGQIEGAWRSSAGGYGLNGSGFVSDATLVGRDLEVNYFVGQAKSPVILHLRQDANGTWRGTSMNVAGEKTPVVLTRAAGG